MDLLISNNLVILSKINCEGLIMFPDSSIVLHLSGSISYGTNHANSDEDIRGIYVAPKHMVNTPFYAREEYEVINIEEHEDAQIWELSKFLREAVGCSPNYIETLFVDRSELIKTTDTYEVLRSHSNEFITLQLAQSFLGFAQSQMRQLVKANKDFTIDPGRIPNQKRRKFIEDFGYDTKHGMHALRAVLMANEIAKKQEVIIKRPDAPMLKSYFIDGELSLGELSKLFAKKEEEAAISIANSTKLPLKVNKEKIAKLMIELQDLALT